MISFAIYFRDLSSRGAEAIESLLRVFEKHGYVPSEFGGSAKSMKELVTRLHAEVSGKGSVTAGFERREPPMMSGFVISRKTARTESGAGTIIRGSLDATPATPALLVELSGWGDALYGIAHDAFELAHIEAKLQPKVDASFEVREIFHFNILGKALVEQLGRERVLTAPAAKIVPLPNGAVVIDAGESAEQQAKVFAHLRPDQPVRVRQVPARVPPNWDADLAPVFATLIECTAMEERNALTTRFNALRPAALTDFQCPPYASDVDDPPRLIKLFRSVAEELIVLLHDQEPALGSNAGPEVLPLLDVHFYQEDYPGTFGAEKTARLLRPLGAWLGGLLVRELGGTWVPRMKMDEIAVAGTSSPRRRCSRTR